MPRRGNYLPVYESAGLPPTLTAVQTVLGENFLSRLFGGQQPAAPKVSRAAPSGKTTKRLAARQIAGDPALQSKKARLALGPAVRKERQRQWAAIPSANPAPRRAIKHQGGGGVSWGT